MFSRLVRILIISRVSRHEGDIDEDGDVDFVDFAILASNWLAGK